MATLDVSEAPGQLENTVLVVDDNNLGRTVISRLLTHAGFRVEEAGSGQEALSTLVRTPVGLVLLDLVMQPIDGFEVLRRVRKVWGGLDLPVIMISGAKDHELMVEALDLGANDYLTRPVPKTLLVAKVRRHLALRRPKKKAAQPGGLARHAVLEPGTTISHYRLDTALGEGATGRVYRATDVRLLRQVALKALLEHHLRPESVERFLAEARAMARVSHPNVITIYDIGTEPFPYLVMELVDGRGLESAVKFPLDSHQAAQWGLEILEALKAIHSQNIVHRDLKPDNIMLTTSGQLKVMDFGVARMLEAEDEESGQLFGTPEFMSPEQVTASFGPLDARSDLFSVAGLLYLFLTGSTPFAGAAQQTQLLFAIISKDPDSPSALNSAVPSRLGDICLKGLAKQPADRYQTAEEFAAALRDFLH